MDGTKILKEVRGNNTLVPLYDNEDSVCGIAFNGTPYYFLKNLQGDVIAITDQNGNTVARYSYDAWGVCSTVSDTSGCAISIANPFRYRSYYYDTETGLYYLQSRYYDPFVGRFINGDEINIAMICSPTRDVTAEVNLFAYCANSPVIFSDVFGYKKKRMSVTQTLVFGIIGLVVNLVKHGTNIFRIFQSTSVTAIEKTILSIAFLLPTNLAIELTKYHVRNLASAIVTYSSSIVFELAILGLNAGKLSVAGLIINTVCTIALFYLPKLVDSINMIFYGLKKKSYYWDVKWNGIKYYSK